MTLHLGDARWRSAVDAELRGEATPGQAELLKHYAPEGDEHRAEAAFLAALAERPSCCEGSSPAWLNTALDAYTETTRAPASPHRWPWLAAAAALLIAAGAGVFALHQPESSRRLEGTQVATLPSLEAPPSPTKEDEAAWRITSGAARLEATLPLDQALTVDARLCARQPGHTICADDGARITARSSGALALHEGKATVRSESSEDIRVELDAVTVHAAAHSVVVIDRRTAGWSVSVESGSATVTELGSSRRLGAGERLARGGDESPVPEVRPRSAPRAAKASTLLGRARSQRRDGDPPAAMKTYAELIHRHPRSPAAQTARMSLAQLHLDRGAPDDALRLFRAYGKRGGALAEDAAYGEIRALRKLGRTTEAKRATEAFVRRYPDSPYDAKLKP